MKKIKLLLLFVATAAVSVSCDLGDEAPYYGDSRAIVGFAKTSQSNGIVTDGTDKTVNMVVELIGGNQGLPADSDIAVTYDFDATSSTATLGHEFDFASANHTAIIPAGSKSVVIPITVHSNNVVVNDDKTIVIKLTGASSSSATVVGSNYSKLTITLVGSCFSNLAGNYSVAYTSGTFPIVVTEVGVGSYKSNVTPGYTQYDMFFSDLCDTLTITNWYGNDTYPISGTGTVQPNGDLRWTSVTITGIYSNRQYLFRKVN